MVEHYASRKKNQISLMVIVGMEVENSMSREISQIQEGKYYLFSIIHGCDLIK